MHVHGMIKTPRLNLLLHNTTYLLNKLALCKIAPLKFTCHHLNHFMAVHDISGQQIQ